MLSLTNMALQGCEPCCFLNQNNPATFLCLDCQEVYCDKCKTDHSKFRVLRRHEISKISENNNLVESNDQVEDLKMGKVNVPVNETLKRNKKFRIQIRWERNFNALFEL